ncbi:CBS domain-containing protein [Chloroflexota bacterium]
MLIKDIMTKNVMTMPSSTSIGDAKKFMKDHRFRRLPVVDDDQLVGIVTRDRLERFFPPAPAPLWQVNYLVHQTTLSDIMESNVVTISPEATVEQAVSLAQGQKVGSLVVVEGQKVIGIATTNDFFHNVINPLLGLSEHGTRIIVSAGGDSKSVEKIVGRINELGVRMKLLWIVASSSSDSKDVILHLDTDDAAGVIRELQNSGFSASIRPR